MEGPVTNSTISSNPPANSPANASNATNLNCPGIDSHYVDIATTVGVAMASLSFLACVVVIILIFLFKKHHFRPQRLILYLTISVMINCLSISMHKIYYLMEFRYNFRSETTSKFCIFTGYFSQTSRWFELMAVTALTLNMFLTVVVKKSAGWLEGVYFLLIFLLPFTFTWIPFIHGAYGSTGPWCWIKIRDENCKSFIYGTCLRFILWFVPLNAILVVLVTLYGIVICHVSKQKNSWDGNFNPMLRRMKLKMQKEVRPLIWYPLIYFLLHLIPLANHLALQFSSKPQYPLWILTATTLPLQGGFIALAFTLDAKTLRRLRWGRIKGAMRRIGKGSGVAEYPAEHMDENTTDSSSSSDEEEEGEGGGEGEGEGGGGGEVGRQSRQHYIRFTRPS